MNFLRINYIKYPLIMIGIIILCLIYMHLSGQYNQFPTGGPTAESLLMLAAPLIVWFLGIRAKKKQLKGRMSFKQGFSEAFKMSLVFGIISPFIFLIYYIIFNPGIVHKVGDVYGIMNAPSWLIIAYDMAVQFLGSLIGGVVYGSIVSFFLRNK